MSVIIKHLILPLILLLSINAHAQAVPKPSDEPSPALPKTSANQERHTYIDRPYKSANSETYTTKKVPLDKSKMGKWFKKLPKPDMLSIGILVLGGAVDYVLDPENNTAQFVPKNQWYCSDGKGGNISPETYSQNYCASIGKSYHHTHDFKNGGQFIAICNDKQDYFQYFRCFPQPQEKTQIPLDELADKLIDSAKKGNPDAKKWVQDWADDEVRTNPNAYPEHQPSPQPNPKDEPQAEPRPKPNPGTSPNTQPQPNPSETIKPCEKGYYRTAHGFCVPDPAYNPDKDNPKPSDEPSPKPSDEPSPNPNTDPSSQPNPKDEEQKHFELPGFCDWAKPVCSFIDWFKTEPDYLDSELPEKDIPVKSPLEFDKDYVKANAQCPPDIVVPFNTGFSSHELVFNLTPICDFVRIYLSKVVLIMAYVFATLHISSAFKV